MHKRPRFSCMCSRDKVWLRLLSVHWAEIYTFYEKKTNTLKAIMSLEADTPFFIFKAVCRHERIDCRLPLDKNKFLPLGTTQSTSSDVSNGLSRRPVAGQDHSWEGRLGGGMGARGTSKGRPAIYLLTRVSLEDS